MLDCALSPKLLFNSAEDDLFNRRSLGGGAGFELAIKVIGYIHGRPHNFTLPYLWQDRSRFLDSRHGKAML